MDADRDKEIIKLRRAGWSGRRIARRLGRSLSQTYRDLDRLRDAGHDLPRTIGSGRSLKDNGARAAAKGAIRFGTMGDMLDELTAHETQILLRHQRRRESVARMFARLLREAYAPNAHDTAA